MLALIHWTLLWLSRLGLPTVFVILLAESLGIPSPSEVVLLLAGLLVAEGHFSFVAVTLVGALGSTLGATVAFTLARVRGREFVLRRMRHVSARLSTWERWETAFTRRGFVIVAVGRVISGVRMLISYPAGLFHLSWRQFLPATILGSLAWAALATGVGDVAGPRVLSLLATLHTAEDYALGAVAAAALVWWGWRHYGRRPVATVQPEPDD
jgi:membrane protein DedA with SNARE-associated domain